MSQNLTDKSAQMFRAVRNNELPAVSSLVTSDPSLVTTTNRQGWTPLLIAVGRGYADICLALLAHGAAVTDVTPGNLKTPLHYASMKGHTAVVEILIQHQAMISAKDRLGFTPLQYASANGHLDCVLALCSAGADMTAVSNDGQAAIHRAAARGHNEVVVALLGQGCEVNMVSGHTV
jgi:ankyrin repeat protein